MIQHNNINYTLRQNNLLVIFPGFSTFLRFPATERIGFPPSKVVLPEIPKITGISRMQDPLVIRPWSYKCMPRRPWSCIMHFSELVIHTYYWKEDV